MKKIFSVLMLSVFLLIISQQALIILHFKVNQKAIEKQFCVNKNKPALQCHGKCHLNTELQKTDHTNSETVIIFKNIDLIFAPSVEFAVKTIQIRKQKKALIHKEANPLAPYLKIVVPPPILALVNLIF